MNYTLSRRLKTALTFGVQSFNSLWKPPQKWGSSYFYSGNFNPWLELDYLKAFLEIPELNAVILSKARMFGNGIIKEVDDNGNEIKNSKLVAALRNPNWMQGEKEFMRQTKLFREIFGNEYLFEMYPVGRDFEEAKNRAIYTLPPNWMKIRDTATSPRPFFLEVEQPDSVKYYVCWNGQEYPIKKELLIHLNDDRVDMSHDITSLINNSMIYKGESKIRALTPALNNLRMAYETRGVLLKHRGALGILSNSTSDKIGAIPLDPEERDRIQDEYKNKYGGLHGQYSLIISAADLKWQQMTVNPDKLGLYTETAEDFNKILDSYGMPSELYVRDKGATYENQKNARKGAYIDTIIPEANEWISGFNNKHRRDSKTKLIIDFFHLPIFQEDLKQRGDSLTAMTNALSKALADQAIDLEQYKKELEKFGIKYNKTTE